MSLNMREVMELLLQGKKIRCNSWNEHDYIYLNDDGKLKDESEENKVFFAARADEKIKYSEYKKPKYNTAKQAMQALLDGKKIRSDKWEHDNYIYIDDNGELKNKLNNDAYIDSAWLPMEDY